MRIGLSMLVAFVALAMPISSQEGAIDSWAHFPQDGWELASVRLDEDGHAMLVNWQAPPNRGDSGALIHNTALMRGADEFFGFPPGTVLAFSGEQCPKGWAQKTTDSGEPLFYAFGLLVDAAGEPHSGFQRLPACEKQP